MLKILALVVTVALGDSLNPSTIGPALFIASGKRARLAVVEFTLAVFVVHFAGGAILLLGPGHLLLSLVNKLAPTTRDALELAAGLALLLAGAVIWNQRHRLARKKLPSPNPGRKSSILLGATIIAIELPTAFPYFAAITAILGAADDTPAQLSLLAGRIQSVVATLDLEEVAMGRPKGWAASRTGRPVERSPGRPPAGRREHRVRFWAAIRRGVSTVEAAVEAGVSEVVGVRWFREGGGMPSVTVAPLSGRYLSFAEREEIALLRAEKLGVREIARRIGRSPSTISRELRRNAGTRSGSLTYRGSTAQWHADRRGRRPKPAKLAANPALRRYVQDRLSGAVQRPDGCAVAGLEVRWIGRRHGPRKDRRWGKSWSPEQISNRLRLDFPDDESMRISHEAIYQSLYVQGRGALRQELTACLRTGRALRVPRARARRGKSFVTDQVLISERPGEAADRAVPGHWEGDLIIGLDSSAIGTLVERSSRFTMLLHLPPMSDQGPRVKNGPALAGHGAEAVRDSIAEAITTLPMQLRRSLTWDQGTEMAQHAQLRIQTGLPVFFCDPHSPWQRGTNENTNGLLRQYFPKGTDLSRHSADDLAAVAATLNSRPRKTLDWRTPAEALNEYLSAAS